MKFEDVYGRWQGRRLSQAEAAEILGMSERTFRRWRDRYCHHPLGRRDPVRAERRVGRAAGPLHDPGNHRADAQQANRFVLPHVVPGARGPRRKRAP